MSRRLIFILLPLLIAPSMVAAQTPRSLVQGQQVRVVSRCELGPDSVAKCPEPGMPSRHKWTYSGKLLALEGDTMRIRVRANETALAIPTASITRVAYLDGRRGNTLRGASIGLLSGALIGGLIGSTQSFQGSFFFHEGQEIVVGVILGAPAGFLLGGIVGTLVRSDRWLAVPSDDHRIRVAPRLDSLGFTVTVTF